MNKELKALESIYWYIVATGAEDDYKKHYERIKKALKDARKHKEKPKEIVGTTTLDKSLEQFLIDSCPEVKKKIKVFEIIKNKGISTCSVAINYDDFERYSKSCFRNYNPLTKEEYDFLKEALK